MSEQQKTPAMPARRRLRVALTSRVRRKLILLHTVFTVLMAVVLFLVLRPALRELVAMGERRECQLALAVLEALPEDEAQALLAREVEGIDLAVVDGSMVEATGLDAVLLGRARSLPGIAVFGRDDEGWPIGVKYEQERRVYLVAGARSGDAERAMDKLYFVLTITLVGIYTLVALTLELLVLPRQVYKPISRLLRADAAVQQGDRDNELIGEVDIPGDEIGSIMRSRNASIVMLREKERRLGDAMTSLEEAAAEVRRKNHLLERAKQNLADQDRLASLGMMAAGVAHEMNTPLAVLKGTVTEIEREPGKGIDASRAGLMGRVVRRLEKLSESLLDFARVRESTVRAVDVGTVIDEAWTLVSLDREAARVKLDKDIAQGLTAPGDADRLAQVFVNLLRNAVDAVEGEGVLTVGGQEVEREGGRWVRLTFADDGPGIDPAVFPRLFEPFSSTRLDSHGTGLGLAVAAGIVEEHGGTLVARNRRVRGAEFELMLPLTAPAGPGLGTTSSTQENLA